MATPKFVFAHAQSCFAKMTKYKVVPKEFPALSVYPDAQPVTVVFSEV